jgi:hypothetical protein
MSSPEIFRNADPAARVNRRMSPAVPRSITASTTFASEAKRAISRRGLFFTIRMMSWRQTGAYRRPNSGNPALHRRRSTDASTTASDLPILWSAELSMAGSATSKVNSVLGRP